MFKQLKIEERERVRQSLSLLKHLNKCTHLSHSDKTIIRSHFTTDTFLQSIFEHYALHRQISSLQNRLRQYIQKLERKKPLQQKLKRPRKTSMIRSPYGNLNLQSLQQSQANSLRNSIESKKGKQKTIKIDVSQMRRSLQKIKERKLSLQILTPKLKLCSTPVYALKIQQKKTQDQMASKKQIKSELYIKQVMTLPDIKANDSQQYMYQFQNDQTQSFPNGVCCTEEIEHLMRSKLKKSKKVKGSIKNPLNLFIKSEQANKQNTDYCNRQQSASSPFLTDYDAKTTRFTDREREDPMFGQVHKKIKGIIDSDQY